MKLQHLVILGLLITSTAPFARSSEKDATTQAAAGSKLEVRAMEEFSRGNFAQALILLRKVAQDLKDQPERLGAIEETIRVCEKNVKELAEAGQMPTNKPPPTAEQRKPHAPPQPGKVLEMEIKDLGNFDYDIDVGGNIPDDVKRLNGAVLRLRGFMIPMDQADNITEFALVPSLFACCFGQPPQVQHTVVVRVPKGQAVTYYPDEIMVDGKLTVDEKKEDGFIVSVFELDCTSVKPSAK